MFHHFNFSYIFQQISLIFFSKFLNNFRFSKKVMKIYGFLNEIFTIFSKFSNVYWNFLDFYFHPTISTFIPSSLEQQQTIFKTAF